jgi:hypothetical protein
MGDKTSERIVPGQFLKATTGLAILAFVLVVSGYFSILARPHPSDPVDSQIFFDDLEAFASAHEVATANNLAPEAYGEHYFSTKSPAVEAFTALFEISADQVAADAHERPKIYDLIIKRTDEIIATEPDIRRSFAKLEERYPEAVFPPVHILYGSYRARGLIRPFGIMIGAEFFIGGDGAEDTEGWNNSSGLIVLPELLSSQLIHELAHIQQARKSPFAYISNGTVLNWSIYEGAADFVAASITGAHTSEAAHIYLASNEDKLWCAFRAAIDEDRRSHWIDASIFGRPPGGIAAAFGYRIVESYYEQHQDPEKAIVELIELSGYEGIYERSGIKARLEKLCG